MNADLPSLDAATLPLGKLPSRAAGWRGHAITLAKCSITGASLWWVSRLLNPHAVGAILARASWPGLALSLVFFLFMAVLGGVRWWVLLRAMRQPAHIGALISLFWTGMVLNQVLPAAAGDTARIWLAARRGCRLRAAINSILLDRVFMLAALLAVLCASQPLLAALVPHAPPWSVSAVLAAGAFAGIGVLAFGGLVTRRLPDWRVLRLISLMSADTRAVAFSAWGLPMAVLCVLGNLNFVVAGWALGEALGLHLGLSAYLAFIPLVVVVTVLPISIAGWGLREGLLVSLLAHAGVAAETALAFSLMFGALGAASSLPGLFFWWLQPERPGAAAAI